MWMNPGADTETQAPLFDAFLHIAGTDTATTFTQEQGVVVLGLTAGVFGLALSQVRSAVMAFEPIGSILSLDPLPRTLIVASFRLRSLRLVPTSSERRSPEE